MNLPYLARETAESLLIECVRERLGELEPGNNQNDWKDPLRVAVAIHGGIVEAGSYPDEHGPEEFRMVICAFADDHDLEQDDLLFGVEDMWNRVLVPAGCTALGYAFYLAQRDERHIALKQPVYNEATSRHARILVATLHHLGRITGTLPFLSSRTAAELLNKPQSYTHRILGHLRRNKTLIAQKSPDGAAPRYIIDERCVFQLKMRNFDSD